MTLTLSLALTLAQVKAGRGGECFSPQAYESAVGYWASAIEAELARRAEAKAQATYDPNLNPRISEAAPAEVRVRVRVRVSLTQTLTLTLT